MSSNSSTTTILLMPKEEFKEILENRIAIGKDLLKASIPSQITGTYFGNTISGDRIERKYDETALKEFKAQYRKWNDYNSELLRRAFKPNKNEYEKSYKSCSEILVGGDSHDALKTYKNVIEYEIADLEGLIDKLPLIPSPTDESPVITTGRSTTITSISTKRVQVSSGNTKDIFIVHGHDNETKQTVARLLEKLKLHPIILHEQPNKGMTIIEKLEKAGSTAGFAVILLTPDDTGKANREENFRPRARQNVIFEMGYFMKQIGRENIMLLLAPGVDKPGDLDGLIYTSLDAAGAWKYELVKELRSSGFQVSADDIL